MSTEELRFDGRVAVVTGAGRGLGREHAIMLAGRGAKVIVNNRTGAAADAVVAEITDAGGIAVACESDVTSKAGAQAPVAAAIERFGRVDILVNNAGIYQFGAFGDYPDELFDGTIDSHVRGSWYATQAARPQMIEQGYGRVVMIGSRVMIGQANNAAYSAAKGALLGMANSLAVEGRPHGIQVNTLSVGGYTDGVKDNIPDPALRQWIAAVLPAWAVARPLAWLVHEDCPASGEFFSAFGRGFSRLFLGEGPGHMSPSEAEHTPEAIRNEFAAVYDEDGYVVARDNAESAAFVAARLGGPSVDDIRAAHDDELPDSNGRTS
ncbi:MAG: SDR family NAD(P)-dependent oxidoreductase [Patulibacter sp.]|nr:SDR family NAD(P)-dependent oxidoreductase [Patulibacter sp.]